MKKYIDTRGLRSWLSSVRLTMVLGLLWLNLISVPSGFGQSPPKTVPVVAQDDRSPLRVRYPDADKLRDLQTDHDYQYGNEAPPSANPLLRLLNWLFHKLSAFLNSTAYQNVWQYILLAAIAGFAVYLLMKAEVLSFLFPNKAQANRLDYENFTENIHEINFEAAIEEAVDQRNFRLAVRLLYLQTLKRLTDASLISYQPDKTNRQYVYELAKLPLQADFERLTHQFEFVWYGAFPIDEARYITVQNLFRQFDLTLKPQPTYKR